MSWLNSDMLTVLGDKIASTVTSGTSGLSVPESLNFSSVRQVVSSFTLSSTTNNNDPTDIHSTDSRLSVTSIESQQQCHVSITSSHTCPSFRNPLDLRYKGRKTSKPLSIANWTGLL